ncbi:hypothetical protein HK405_003136, partial [Cladochytrium tenue]
GDLQWALADGLPVAASGAQDAPEGDAQSDPYGEIRLGCEVVSFEVVNKGSAVRVDLADGSHVEGCLLVGADGVHSRVRGLIAPEFAAPRHVGYDYLQAVVDLKTAGVETNMLDFANNVHSGDAWETWGVGLRFAYVPLRPPFAYWFASHRNGLKGKVMEHSRVTNTSTVPFPTAVAKALSHWHAPVADLLRATPPGAVKRTHIAEVNLPSRQWAAADKRVVLIGDAAHAMPPNLAAGGMSAMLDALQLASLIRKAATNYGTTAISDESLSVALKEYVKELEKAIGPKSGVKVVVNTIGPFQDFADYRVARICAKLGVSYVDLADGRDYVCRFSDYKVSNGRTPETMNSFATKKGCVAIAGASSVPGLSSAMVSDLIHRYNVFAVEKISIAISPGNHTPRGLATMRSILGQVGKPMQWTKSGGRGSSRTTTTGWWKLTRSKVGQFHPSMKNPRRWLSAVDVPDLELLPEFAAREAARVREKIDPSRCNLVPLPLLPCVEFRAGLEAEVMHLGLYLLSFLVKTGLVRDLARYAPLLKRISEWRVFREAGSDSGGMFVELVGWSAPSDSVVAASPRKLKVVWRLHAGSGEGVQIPAMPSVIIVRRLFADWTRSLGVRRDELVSRSGLVPGAHPCVGVFDLADFSNAVKGYDITHDEVARFLE